MIRCANNGVSCEIDQNGTVIDRLRDAAGASIDVAGIFARTLNFYPRPADALRGVGGLDRLALSHGQRHAWRLFVCPPCAIPP